MKYLLMPLTLLLWFLIAYDSIYFRVFALNLVFSVSWFWLILGFILWITIILLIVTTIRYLVYGRIVELYGLTWFSSIVHSLAGLVGIVALILFFSANYQGYYRAQTD